jgi:hypothetical protein
MRRAFGPGSGTSREALIKSFSCNSGTSKTQIPCGNDKRKIRQADLIRNSLNALWSCERGCAGMSVGERSVQGGHGFQGDGFGAGLGGDGFGPCCGELVCGVAGVAEVVGEGLALLGEAGAEEAVEAFGVDGQFGEAGGEVEAEDRGVDVGRWVEGAGRQREEVRDLGVELGEGREWAVVADAGCGGDAVGDFALHHQDGAAEQALAGGGEEVEEDVGGDVVGEVADDVEGGKG